MWMDGAGGRATAPVGLMMKHRESRCGHGEVTVDDLCSRGPARQNGGTKAEAGGARHATEGKGLVAMITALPFLSVRGKAVGSGALDD